jgi:hypothetical protein
VAVGDADEIPRPFWSVLLRLDEHGQPGGVFGEVTDVQADELAAA